MSQVEHPASRKYFLGAAFSIIVGTVFYLVVLSPNGLLVKLDLEERKARFEELVQNLETEGQKLKEKHNLLKDDEIALATEAKKYLLLDNNSQILRFIEPETPTLQNAAANSTMMDPEPGQNAKSDNVNTSLENVRFIYKVVLAIISIVLLLIAIRKRLTPSLD